MDLQSYTANMRLTADPEIVSLASGAKIIRVRLALNMRKKNKQTGEWEDDPLYIDGSAYSSEDNSHMHRLGTEVRKGERISLRGILKLDSWMDKTTNQPRSKIVLNIQDYEVLTPKEKRQVQPGQQQQQQQNTRRQEAYVPPRDSGDTDVDDSSIPF